jgi:hypothetical protein
LAGHAQSPVAERRPAIRRQDIAPYARERIEAALAFPRARLPRRRIAGPALDVDVLGNSDLADLCAASFAARPGGPPRRPLLIHVLDAAAMPWDPPASLAAGLSPRDVDRELAACGLRGSYHHDSITWQFFDPARSVGVYSLTAMDALPPWERSAPLRLFLHWAYAAVGRRLAHAATLGAGDAGVLVAGPSGSGKSGTALAGVMNGLTSVGDDYVCLDLGREIVARPVFRTFKQDGAGLRRAGLAPGDVGSARPNWQGKYEFQADMLVPGALADSLRLKAILIPEIARLPATRITPLASASAAVALAPSGVFQLHGDTESGFRFLAGVARRLPAFRLALSEDPAEIARAIAGFLGR